MKKRGDKIRKLFTLESAEEQRHGARTGRSRRNLAEQLARLGELNAYRHGYAGLSKSIASVDAAHWKDYQNFLQRLDQAVVSQQQVVRDSEHNLEMHRRRWLAKRQRLDSLARVLERYETDERQFQKRQAQRFLDDLPAPGRPYADETEE